MSREFYVPCTPYAYQIRSKYQSISERFKSLLRSINSRQHRVNNSDTRIRRIRRRRRLFREENSSRNIEKLDGTSSNCKTKEEVSNVATTSFEDNERRSETTIDLSTSSMLTANNSNDDDEEEKEQQQQQQQEQEQQQQQPQPDEEPSMFPTERIISLENAIVVPNGSRRNRNARRRQLTRMVSNSTNTVEITQEVNLESFFGSDAIVAENLIEYGAALHSIQFGMQRIPEPINIVPGLFITQEDQPYQSEISFDDYTNENSINESNMVNGSEVSSYTDSIEEVERRDQASGQDDELPILFYDPRTPMFIWKSLYQNDDPSIY